MENKRNEEVLQKYNMGYIINLYDLTNRELLDELAKNYKSTYLGITVNGSRKIYLFNIWKREEHYTISIWTMDNESILSNYIIKEDRSYESSIEDIYERLNQYEKGYKECSHCNRVIKPEEKTYWYPYTGVVCKECNELQEVIDKRKEAMEMLD